MEAEAVATDGTPSRKTLNTPNSTSLFVKLLSLVGIPSEIEATMRKQMIVQNALLYTCNPSSNPSEAKVNSVKRGYIFVGTGWVSMITFCSTELLLPDSPHGYESQAVSFLISGVLTSIYLANIKKLARTTSNQVILFLVFVFFGVGYFIQQELGAQIGDSSAFTKAVQGSTYNWLFAMFVYSPPENAAKWCIAMRYRDELGLSVFHVDGKVTRYGKSNALLENNTLDHIQGLV